MKWCSLEEFESTMDEMVCCFRWEAEKKRSGDVVDSCHLPGLELVFDVVCVCFLNDNLVISDSDEHFVTDLHSGNGKFVFVKIDMNVVILAVVVFRATWTELLLSDHRGVLVGLSPEHLLKLTARE
jgi:hypothetical protein